METKAILKGMSLEEKADLLMGTSAWYTKGYDKYNIPSIRMSDGPYGLRIVNDVSLKGEEATCFPPLVTLANTFDPEMAFEMGVALGEECQEKKVNMLLGPAINIKRSPLGGRNFEYLSEDPYLTGRMATEYVNGLQSQGVGACVKHFCLNNEENYRFTAESGVDERAMYEIYLKPFQMVIKGSNPKGLMASYNRFNGEKVVESSRLLIQVARNEFNFAGVMVSDWGATTDREKSLVAGLDLEMPGDDKFSKELLVNAIKNKTLDMGAIDRSCQRIIALADELKSSEIPNYKCDYQAHHKIAISIAAEGAVLLKNNGSVLPLKKGENVCLIGAMCKNMRFEGAGSSKVTPLHLVQPIDALKAYGIFPYEAGYKLYDHKVNKELEDAAIRVASRSDKVIFFGGTPSIDESEGYDKKSISLPENQLSLLNRLAKELDKPIVVVLFGGAPIELPFNDEVSAILAMYLPGEGGGQACSELLFGEVNPSGRLAETWPIKLEDVPCYNYYDESPDLTEYRESIYVGYRYYQKANVKVRYPFGHGLSYTKFKYSNITIRRKEDKFYLSFKLKNIGTSAGSEVVQVYVGHEDTAVFKAKRELVRFSKVFLNAGEEKKMSFTLTKNDFGYYNIKERHYVVEAGLYTIELGKSSDDIFYNKSIKVPSEESSSSPYQTNKIHTYFAPSSNLFPEDEFAYIIGKKYSSKRVGVLPLTINSVLSDFRYTFWGRFLYRIAIHIFKKEVKKAEKCSDPNLKEIKISEALSMMNQIPNVTIGMASSIDNKKLPHEVAEGIVMFANGKVFTGLRKVLFHK